MALDNTFAITSAVADGLGWTITTPLCLLQGDVFDKKLTCLPLPDSEGFSRYLTLVARRNELGDLPERLAKDSRAIIQRHFLPKVKQALPWIYDAIKIGS